jgi:hypothetical protein
MRKDGDPRLLEVERLVAPALAPARARQIGQQARTKFAEAGEREAGLPRREGTLANVFVAAMLGACALGYLTWTAQTLSALQPLQLEATRPARLR